MIEIQWSMAPGTARVMRRPLFSPPNIFVVQYLRRQVSFAASIFAAVSHRRHRRVLESKKELTFPKTDALNLGSGKMPFPARALSAATTRIR
jgi:hypothetical protein